MLSLSPAKILVVLVVALIVLGPEKLPGVARQLGAMWGDLRKWRTRLESEVRGAFPDLPPTHEVAQAVRSPMAFLNRLADEHERDRGAADAGVAPDNATDEHPLPHLKPANLAPTRIVLPELADGAMIVVPDDPSMN